MKRKILTITGIIMIAVIILTIPLCQVNITYHTNLERKFGFDSYYWDSDDINETVKSYLQYPEWHSFIYVADHGFQWQVHRELYERVDGSVFIVEYSTNITPLVFVIGLFMFSSIRIFKHTKIRDAMPYTMQNFK